MDVSKEEESYRNFTSLRDKFTSSAQKQEPQQLSDRTRSGAGKPRRAGYDHRVTATPLMPLVEEGDQIQEELYATDVDERLRKLACPKLIPTSTPVKGKWKHSLQYKSNHLNGPDFDALETASVTSCSSAYSSRSESTGTFSPFPGSVTELSDVGSCDTFLEYDHHPHRHAHNMSLSEARFVDSLPDDVPPELVPTTTKAWNKVIGDWVFQGVSREGSPSQPRTRRPSNEVRVPTPLSTPLGSTDNLLQDSGSRSSILSYSSIAEDDDDPPQWTPCNTRMGRFVRPESNLTTSQVSNSSLSEDLDSEETTSPTDQPKAEPTTTETSLVDHPSNRWQEVMAKFKKLQATEKSEETDSSSTQTPTLKESGCSIVESRAERFGGTKRGLRRAQSFQIDTRTSKKADKPNLSNYY